MSHWLYLIPITILSTIPLNYYLIKNNFKRYFKWWGIKIAVVFPIICILNWWLMFTNISLGGIIINIGGTILFLSLLADMMYIKRPSQQKGD